MRVLFFTSEHNRKCDLIRNAINEVRDDEFHHFLPKGRQVQEFDFDKKKSIAETLGVTKTPTLLLQYNGEIINEFKGLPTKSNMLKFLKKVNSYK